MHVYFQRIDPGIRWEIPMHWACVWLVERPVLPMRLWIAVMSGPFLTNSWNNMSYRLTFLFGRGKIKEIERQKVYKINHLFVFTRIVMIICCTANGKIPLTREVNDKTHLHDWWENTRKSFISDIILCGKAQSSRGQTECWWGSRLPLNGNSRLWLRMWKCRQTMKKQDRLTAVGKGGKRRHARIGFWFSFGSDIMLMLYIFDNVRCPLMNSSADKLSNDQNAGISIRRYIISTAPCVSIIGRSIDAGNSSLFYNLSVQQAKHPNRQQTLLHAEIRILKSERRILQKENGYQWIVPA